MKPANYISTFLCVLAICSLSAEQSVPESQVLDDGRQWLDSRALPARSAPALLRAAHVTMQDNPALGGRCCIGNIGLDLLLQRGAVTIDFSEMTLRVR